MSTATCPRCKEEGFSVWSRNPGVGAPAQCKVCGLSAVALPWVNGVLALFNHAALLIAIFWWSGYFYENYIRFDAGSLSARAQLWWPLMAGVLLYLAAELARTAFVPLRPAVPEDEKARRMFWWCLGATLLAVVGGIWIDTALKFSS